MSDELPHESTNGTTPRGTVCPGRKQVGALHCWHTQGAPEILPTKTVMFSGICCWCAPTYMHITMMVPPGVSDEDVVAEQMKHGPLITMMSQPRRGPSIMVPGR